MSTPSNAHTASTAARRACAAQVAAYQDQLASLHLRVDNLLHERRRLQEEAAEQARGECQ